MINIEQCRAILFREGFKNDDCDSYWYNNDMFAFEGPGFLFLLPDFNYDETEKKWCTYASKSAPYFKLTDKFIDCNGTEEELMILINAFKKNQKQARIEDKKRSLQKDFK